MLELRPQLQRAATGAPCGGPSGVASVGPVLSVVGMKVEHVVPKSHHLVTCPIHLKPPSRLCPHCLLDTSLLR